MMRTSACEVFGKSAEVVKVHTLFTQVEVQIAVSVLSCYVLYVISALLRLPCTICTDEYTKELTFLCVVVPYN